jgi:hypothetical protein
VKKASSSVSRVTPGAYRKWAGGAERAAVTDARRGTG